MRSRRNARQLKAACTLAVCIHIHIYIEWTALNMFFRSYFDVLTMTTTAAQHRIYEISNSSSCYECYAMRFGQTHTAMFIVTIMIDHSIQIANEWWNQNENQVTFQLFLWFFGRRWLDGILSEIVWRTQQSKTNRLIDATKTKIATVEASTAAPIIVSRSDSYRADQSISNWLAPGQRLVANWCIAIVIVMWMILWWMWWVMLLHVTGSGCSDQSATGEYPQVDIKSVEITILQSQ